MKKALKIASLCVAVASVCALVYALKSKEEEVDG